MLKFLIGDDHPLYREALKGALQHQFADITFVESDTLNSTLNVLRLHRDLAIILLDLKMPDCDNYYGLLRIHQSYPNIPIVVVSASDSLDVIAQVMEFGARAFIPKTTATSDMVEGLHAVLSGNKWLPAGIEERLQSIDKSATDVGKTLRELTPRQFEVLKLVKQGMMNKEIAIELKVTEATVKAHIGTLFKRLNVRSRTQILVAIDKLQFN